MKAIILAAGKSVRLGNLTSDKPKGMLDFMGKSLLEHQILMYRSVNINDIIIIRGYKKEKITYKVQQFLLAMFLMCQFQFIVEASKNCSEDGVEITEEKKKEFKDYVSEISPSKNSRTDLLIRGYHKHSGEVWQITHEGKSSIKKSPDQNKKKKI